MPFICFNAFPLLLLSINAMHVKVLAKGEILFLESNFGLSLDQCKSLKKIFGVAIYEEGKDFL